MAGVTLALLAPILLTAGSAAGRSEALPDGCGLVDGRYVCEWIVDTMADPTERIVDFEVPLFVRAEANVTVATQGYHVGWSVEIIDLELNRTVARIDEIAEYGDAASSETYPLLLIAEPDHPHIFRFSTEFVERDRVSPDVPEATWPGSQARFVITYDAGTLPEGEPAAAPAGSLQDPHLLDAVRDAPREDLDIVAVWFDDARVGDGAFELNVALKNLSQQPASDKGAATSEVIFYRVAFQVDAQWYLMQWSGVAGAWEDWTCFLRRVDDAQGSYAYRAAAPNCVFDVEGSLLAAHITESAVGYPSSDVAFERMSARAETQLPRPLNVADAVNGGNGTRTDDEVRIQRRAFHLADLSASDAAAAAAAAAATAARSSGSFATLGTAAVAGVVGAGGLILLVGIPLAVLARRRKAATQTLLDAEALDATQRRRELYRKALLRLMDDRLSLSRTALIQLADLRKRLEIPDDEHDQLRAEVVAHITTQTGSQHDAPLQAGTVLLDRYHVQALLGEGGGGRTYRCDDVLLDRIVAVKEISTREGATRIREALREARALARVQHPNVVTLLEVHELDTCALLVMEYVQGGALAEALRTAGPRAPDDALPLIRDVLEGLAAIHKAGLLHRDVKPANVLLNEAGRAKLADLGLARPDGRSTMVGLRRAGTPLYMAPEQVLGLDLDARTDLYAVGALLYEMLAGEPYVRVAMREGVLVEEAIVSRPPPLPLEGAPAWANAFMAACLAKDPENRPASARDALAALSNAA